jgi:prepilin-type N-terminal cleavage/methylation domain-containing protein
MGLLGATRRPAERALREERGMSLPELLVAMSIFAILATVIVTMFTGFSRSFASDRSTSESTSVAATAMKELTRVIRSGTEIPVAGSPLNDPVFASASDYGLEMRAYVDTDAVVPAPILVRFSVDATDRLVEERWKATRSADFWSFPATAAPYVRTVAHSLVPRGQSERPLFAYLDVSGQAIPLTAGAVAVQDLRKIAAVQVTLSVRSSARSDAEPVVLQNSVGIPNLGISRVGL